MKFVEDFSKNEYIDWLMAYKDYSYEDAVKMADLMGIKETEHEKNI